MNLNCNTFAFNVGIYPVPIYLHVTLILNHIAFIMNVGVLYVYHP